MLGGIGHLLSLPRRKRFVTLTLTETLIVITLLHVAYGVKITVAPLVQLIGLRAYDLAHNIKHESNGATKEKGEGRLMLYHEIEVNQLSLT